MPEYRLSAAYGAARYRILVGEQRWIERRIGVIDLLADAALATAGCRAHWHIVTPCNPGSARWSSDCNAQRLADFKAHLCAMAWPHLPSENRADDGSWPEAGCCLLDLEPDRGRGT